MSERVYTTIDKSDWGEGPWQDEPDRVQWKDEATGLPCLAKRGPGGQWCGYVGLASDHPLYEKHYTAVYDDLGWDRINVHGGLTYAGHCAEGPEESSICHVPDPGQPDNVWWLGFDCAHSQDVSPARAAADRRRYEETGDPLWLPIPSASFPEAYRTLAYVRAETTDLARQLASVAA